MGHDRKCQIRAAIQQATDSTLVSGQHADGPLKDAIASSLRQAGFEADVGDKRKFLPDRLPVWRCKNSLRVVPTKRRRIIDIVIYSGNEPVALLETESNLKDLRLTGVSTRNGHYDVYSISRRADGLFFHSYNSVERMATAILWHTIGKNSSDPSTETFAGLMEKIKSDAPNDHNPCLMPCFLVTADCPRDIDREILEPRLTSLGADLIYPRLQ